MATETTAKLTSMETSMGMHSLTPRVRTLHVPQQPGPEQQHTANNPKVKPIPLRQQTKKDGK